MTTSPPTASVRRRQSRVVPIDEPSGITVVELPNRRLEAIWATLDRALSTNRFESPSGRAWSLLLAATDISRIDAMPVYKQMREAGLIGERNSLMTGHLAIWHTDHPNPPVVTDHTVPPVPISIADIAAELDESEEASPLDLGSVEPISELLRQVEVDVPAEVNGEAALTTNNLARETSSTAPRTDKSAGRQSDSSTRQLALLRHIASAGGKLTGRDTTASKLSQLVNVSVASVNKDLLALVAAGRIRRTAAFGGHATLSIELLDSGYQFIGEPNPNTKVATLEPVTPPDVVRRPDLRLVKQSEPESPPSDVLLWYRKVKAARGKAAVGHLANFYDHARKNKGPAGKYYLNKLQEGLAELDPLADANTA